MQMQKQKRSRFYSEINSDLPIFMMNKEPKHDEEADEECAKTPKKLEEEIYRELNHIYFSTGVNDKSCDRIKKLFREYKEEIGEFQKSDIVTITPKPVILHINSCGGSVHSSFALYDFIIKFKEQIDVYTVVDGVAASAATIISIAGTKRFITPSSYMLIHQLSTFMGGTYEQIKDEMENCNKIMNKIIQMYGKHTKINKKKIPKLLKHDLWWSAEECKKNGLIDEIESFI